MGARHREGALTRAGRPGRAPRPDRQGRRAGRPAGGFRRQVTPEGPGRGDRVSTATFPDSLERLAEVLPPDESAAAAALPGSPRLRRGWWLARGPTPAHIRAPSRGASGRGRAGASGRGRAALLGAAGAGGFGARPAPGLRGAAVRGSVSTGPRAARARKRTLA